MNEPDEVRTERDKQIETYNKMQAAWLKVALLGGDKKTLRSILKGKAELLGKPKPWVEEELERLLSIRAKTISHLGELSYSSTSEGVRGE